MRIFTTIIMMLSVTLTSLAQQPRKMTGKFFPDPEFPTPSFHQRGFVGYRDMIKYIERTIKGKSYLRLDYIGHTQRNKPIPVVIFKKSANVRARVMITARIHGDEPGGTEGLLYLIERLANDHTMSEFTDDLEVAIMPMVNIDGGERLRRQTANGLDMNRDMSKLATPEATALRAFFNSFSPEVYLDLHEYNPNRADYMRLGSFGATGYADVMFLSCENPNYSKDLRRFVQKTYLPILEREYDRFAMTHCKYFTSTIQNGDIVLNMGGGSPRSTATAFGLSNTVALLTEIRGSGMGKTNFRRRVQAAYLTAITTIKMAHDRADEICDMVYAENDPERRIVVSQRRNDVMRKVPFIDIHKNEMISVELQVNDAARRKNSLVRVRPYAYAVSAEAEGVVEKLRTFGVDFDILDQATTVEAQVYRVSEYNLGVAKFEGFREQNVRTRLVARNVTLPKGTVIIPMDQRRADLVAVLLEPEADNGFVRYNILMTGEGQELPIMRIMNSF